MKYEVIVAEDNPSALMAVLTQITAKGGRVVEVVWTRNALAPSVPGLLVVSEHSN